MKTSFVSGLWPIVGGFVLVIAVTATQGFLTDRWSGRNVAADLERSSELLESRFPSRFGTWTFAQDIPSDPKQLARAGAVGHVSKLYQDSQTRAKISAFVVCATPHDASGHTPDRCYPGAGFEIAETEHRQSVVLSDGRTAEVFTGTFRKPGQTLRIYWTYGVDGRWIAPQIARIELAGTTAVYKLYAIIDETQLSSSQAPQVCNNFLAALLPEFDRAVLGKQFGNTGISTDATLESAPTPNSNPVQQSSKSDDRPVGAATKE